VSKKTIEKFHCDYEHERSKLNQNHGRLLCHDIGFEIGIGLRVEKEKKRRFEELFDVPEKECLMGNGWIAPFEKHTTARNTGGIARQGY